MSSHAVRLIAMTDAGLSTRYGYLASVLRDRIREGRYQVGEELPSISAMAGEMSVSHMTVKQALRVLSDEGVITTRRGTRARVVSLPPSAPAPIPAQLQEIQARLNHLESRTQALERHASKTTEGSQAKP